MPAEAPPFSTGCYYTPLSTVPIKKHIFIVNEATLISAGIIRFPPAAEHTAAFTSHSARPATTEIPELHF